MATSVACPGTRLVRACPLKTALFLAVVMACGATEALAQGTISGRVTSSTTSLGLPNTVVQFYDLEPSLPGHGDH